ncbi:MAG: hypothetical protein P8Y93_09150 [Acidobacteriota bacterium]
MSKSAFSVFVFSIYLFALGATLVAIPNVLLQLFGLPETGEVWIRVVGVLVLVLGYYYQGAARGELTDFLRWTVHARLAVLVFFTAFAVIGLVSPVLVLFGTVDAMGGLWTALALRADRAAQGKARASI